MNIQAFYDMFTVSGEYYANALADCELQKSPPCDECGRDSYIPIASPFGYSIEGLRLGDVMTLWYGYYLVSEKVRRLFEENNVTGVTFHTDVKCIDWHDRKRKKVDKPFPEYVYMTIDSRCGEVLLSNGKRLPRCKKCGMISNINALEVKTAFNIDCWDGSDIFAYDGSCVAMCTERVKNIAEKNKLKNFAFRRVRSTSKFKNEKS
ncbi:MAG: hypothetical protein K2N72_04440 [Oscillospiraceae bacterium]|nr:hypothetical protein [Oscillospiraceae bacterium]